MNQKGNTALDTSRKPLSLFKANLPHATAAIAAVIVCLSVNPASAGDVAYRDVILGDSPVIYYQFDEASGTTATNSATTGTTYDGAISTVEGTVTLGQSSFTQGGTAYNFGGGAVLSANALASSLPEWTVEAWVNYDSAKTSASNFLGNDQGGWNDDILFGIGAENGDIPASTVGLVHQGNPGSVRESVSSAIDANTWYHIVMTGSESAGELKLFVNGLLVDTNSVLTNGATFNGTGGFGAAPHLTVGAAGPDGYSGRRPYDGLLDEVAIYDSVLAPATIDAHYQAGDQVGGDVTSPTVLALNPANGTQDALSNSRLVVTFDESIAIDTGNITIKDLDTPSQAVIPVGDAQISISGAVLTINPSSGLTPLTHYAIQIDATAITDLSGNPFAGILDDTTWSFTTMDTNVVVKVLLLGGQSNSVGHGLASELPASPVNLQQPQNDVLFYYDGSPLTTLRPGSGGDSEFPYPSGLHFGPEVTFGREVADASPSVVYAIIKHGEPGTALYNDWALTGDNSYSRFRDTVAAGLAALQTAGYTTEIVGMLWHQGESDAIEGQQADYESNLTAFIADIRTRYGATLPFLIGEIRRSNGAAFDTVADAQIAVAAADANAKFVPASDLTFEDTYHFDTPGMMTLGERFATAYADLVAVNNGTYRDVILGDAPIVYYEFNESSGTTATNSATTGATYDGTINTAGGSVTVGQSSFAMGGTAYDFGGGHVGIAALGSSLTEWTVEAWINWDSAKSSASTVFSNDQSGWNNDVLLGISPEGTSVTPANEIAIIQQAAPGGPRDIVSLSLTSDTWHHVIATSSTTAGELKLYIDGVLVGTEQMDVNLTLNNTDLWIGRRNATGNEFDGLIDEFALYDSVLSATDVANHFSAASAPVVAWTGGATGSWDTGSNWGSATVPASGDTVNIDNAAVSLTDLGDYNPGIVNLTGTASLDIDGGGVAHFQNDTTFHIGPQANFGTGNDLFDMQGTTLNFDSGATADLGVWEFQGSPATVQFNLDATGFETIHTGQLKPEYGDFSQFTWVVDMANYTGGAQTITLLDFSGLDGDGMTAAEFETGTLTILNNGEYNSCVLSWNESTLAVELTINEPITAPLGRQLFADNFNDGRMVNGSFLLRHISDSAWHHAGAWSVSSDALTATGDTDASGSEGAVAKAVRVGKVTGKVITLTFDYTLAAADESLSVYLFGSQINNAEFQYLSDDSDTMGNLSLAASNGSGRYQYLMTNDVFSTEFVNGATLATNGTMGDGEDYPYFAKISGGTSGTFSQSVDLTELGFDGVEDFDFITVVFARDAVAGSEVTIDDLSLVANMRPTTIVGVSTVANNRVKMVVDTPCPELLIPMVSPDLTEGSWTHVAHSNAPGNPFEVTNLNYSTVDGTNMEIYLPADAAKQFFRLQEAPKFTLWQLASQGSSQMNSYVIQTAGGKLIVVDGGNTVDGSYLKNFLAARGNHVHSWFISHPHKDHLDALSWILENQGDLIIDEIYAAIPSAEYLDDGNAVQAVQTFTNALATAGRSYTAPNTGDLFNVDEITIEILSGGYLIPNGNAVNDNSVIMRVSDLTKTVLFTGDLGWDGGDKALVEVDHGKLKSDYVQMCHHGQRGANKNFYEVVDADYALWPTPPWLWDGGRYETLKNRQWMDDLGVRLNYVSGLSGLSEIK